MPQPRATPVHDAEAPVFHPAYIRQLLGFVQAQGGDLHGLLAHAGLAPAALADEAPMLPLASVRWLILALPRVLGRPLLALEAGASVPLQAHGDLGLALQHSATLRDALALLARHLATRTGLYHARLEPVEGGLLYVIAPALVLGEVERFTLEHVAASTCHLLRSISGAAPVASLALPWPRPGWAAAYARLAASCRFQQPRLTLRLTDAMLDRPLPGAHPALCAAALARCEAALGALSRRNPFTEQVQRLLATLPPGGRTLAALAGRLGLSRRTVMRRLAAEGHSFQSLIDASRRAQALALLQGSQRPIAEIATALGYRSGANFSRCVQRWFGGSPRVVRAGRAAPPAAESSCSDTGAENLPCAVAVPAMPESPSCR